MKLENEVALRGSCCSCTVGFLEHSVGCRTFSLSTSMMLLMMMMMMMMRAIILVNMVVFVYLVVYTGRLVAIALPVNTSQLDTRYGVLPSSSFWTMP